MAKTCASQPALFQTQVLGMDKPEPVQASPESEMQRLSPSIDGEGTGILKPYPSKKAPTNGRSKKEPKPSETLLDARLTGPTNLRDVLCMEKKQDSWSKM